MRRGFFKLVFVRSPQTDSSRGARQHGVWACLGLGVAGAWGWVRDPDRCNLITLDSLLLSLCQSLSSPPARRYGRHRGNKTARRTSVSLAPSPALAASLIGACLYAKRARDTGGRREGSVQERAKETCQRGGKGEESCRESCETGRVGCSESRGRGGMFSSPISRCPLNDLILLRRTSRPRSMARSLSTSRNRVLAASEYRSPR